MRQPSKKQPQKPLLDFSPAGGGTREIAQNNRLILPKTCHLLPEVGGKSALEKLRPPPLPLSSNFPDSITRIVASMTLLMESNLVDGEEAATIDSEYVHASCLVTSGTDTMSFEAGESLLRRVASGCYSSVFLCRCFRGILVCSHARNPLEDVIIHIHGGKPAPHKSGLGWWRCESFLRLYPAKSSNLSNTSANVCTRRTPPQK